MNTTKLLKSLLSESYEVEKELNDLIEQCFKEMFGDYSTYAFSLFEEDLQSGREYNGCLQGLQYYKQCVEDSIKAAKEYKEKKEKEANHE